MPRPQIALARGEGALDVHACTRSAAMRDCLASLRLFASIPRRPIYLSGESGVGKTRLAREIHRLRRTSDRPFVSVLLTGFSDTISTAELFGSERGAFTGAVLRHGRLRAAHTGTVFLDEIAKAPPSVQAELLQFLDEQRYTPLGSTTSIALDADVVAASSGSPEEDVKSGRLLHDVWMRFTGFHLRVPALRERREDLPALIGAAVVEAAHLLNFTIAPTLTRGLMDRLVAASWPANFRGLHAAAHLLLAAARGRSEIGEEACGREVIDCMGRTRHQSVDLASATLWASLERYGGNKTKAAAAMGVDRSTLMRHLKRAKKLTVLTDPRGTTTE